MNHGPPKTLEDYKSERRRQRWAYFLTPFLYHWFDRYLGGNADVLWQGLPGPNTRRRSPAHLAPVQAVPPPAAKATGRYLTYRPCDRLISSGEPPSRSRRKEPINLWHQRLLSGDVRSAACRSLAHSAIVFDVAGCLRFGLNPAALRTGEQTNNSSLRRSPISPSRSH